MKILLDAKHYEITEDGIIEQALPDYSAPYRLTTEQGRDALLGVSNWVQKFHGGFGRLRCPDSDPYNEAGKFWDSECETRWAKEGYVTPPLLVNTATVSKTAPDTLVIRKMENMGGNLYAIGNYYDDSDVGGGTPYDIACWMWNPSNWDLKSYIVQSLATAPTVGDLIVHGTKLFMCYFDNVAGTLDHRVSYSSDGITWTATTNTTDLPAGAASDGTNILLSFGTTMLIALWDNSAGQVLIYKTTDEGVNWTSVCSMASAGPALGMVAWVDQDGNDVPWLRLRESWGQIDLTNSVYIPIVNVPAEASTAKGMEVWGGILHVPEQEGHNRCYYSDGALVVQPMGLNKESGLTTTRQGHTTALTRSNRWLFNAYAGVTATGKAGVYAWDGEAWHHIYLHGAANLKILDIAVSSADDDLTRLHIIVLTAADAVTMYYLDYILDNPSQNTSIKFGDGKTIYTPKFSAGMDEITGVLLRDDMSATGLSATTSDEYVKVWYSADGAAFAELGDFLSGDTDLDFASGVGVSFKNVQFVYYLYNNTNTNKVSMVYPVLKFRKKPVTRWARYFTIDIKETAAHDISRSKETIISALKTAKDSQTLLALIIEQATSVNVDITDMKFGYTWERSADMPRAVPREGFVAVTVETLL